MRITTIITISVLFSVAAPAAPERTRSTTGQMLTDDVANCVAGVVYEAGDAPPPLVL